jgi:hypothetical protein
MKGFTSSKRNPTYSADHPVVIWNLRCKFGNREPQPFSRRYAEAHTAFYKTKGVRVRFFIPHDQRKHRVRGTWKRLGGLVGVTVVSGPPDPFAQMGI